MDEKQFFNPNLEARLLKLEEEFKKNNPLGYEQRNKLEKEIEKQNFYVFHSMFKEFIKFTIDISKQEWILLNAWKNASDAFHANDITRLQYIEAAREGSFMGYLPTSVVLCGILNKDTLKKLESISNDELADEFSSTIHGKRIKYLFNDFGLTIKEINFMKSNDGTFNKHTIIIETNMLLD